MAFKSYKVKKHMAPLYGSMMNLRTPIKLLLIDTPLLAEDPVSVVDGNTNPISGGSTLYCTVKNLLGTISGFMKYSDLERTMTEEEKKAQKEKEEKEAAEQALLNAYKDQSLDDRLLDVMISQSISTIGKVDASTRLFGQPFQFSESTDLRIFDSTLSMGRKYTETFIAEGPIVSILPGNSTFLPNVSAKERNDLLDYWKQAGNSAASSKFLNEILQTEPRYFEFVSDYVSYMQYVNLMCRMSSIYMGISDYKVPMAGLASMPLKIFDWKKYRYNKIDIPEDGKYEQDSPFEFAKDLKEQITLENFMSYVKELDFAESATSIFKTVTGERNYVDFYVDPGTSFQESSSNQSVPSKLSSYFESAQSEAKEFYFYAGMLDNGKSGIVDGFVKTVTSAVADGAKTLVDAASVGLISKLFGATSTVIGGGNVIFPEIWGDSSYNKSYSVNINLISPYGTKESVYLHVLVPLFHLMGLALPRQIHANGFAQPFLVKVSSKGWFNCEMGMVESISIEKVQGSYTVNGIPTEIKVSLSIRDLYSELMMTSASKPGLFYSNRGLSNWLAITSGLDVTQSAFKEKWLGILWAIGGTPLNAVNFFDRVLEKVQNIIAPINSMG